MLEAASENRAGVDPRDEEVDDVLFGDRLAGDRQVSPKSPTSQTSPLGAAAIAFTKLLLEASSVNHLR